MHIATRQVLRFFRFDHLSDGPGKEVAAHFAAFAEGLADLLPEDPETTIALRELLKSKDAAVRAALEIPVFE